LHQIGVQPMIFEFLLAPGARKETALVRFEIEVNLEYPRYLSSLKLHMVEFIMLASERVHAFQTTCGAIPGTTMANVGGDLRLICFGLPGRACQTVCVHDEGITAETQCSRQTP
jgi:hypothetical protein